MMIAWIVLLVFCLECNSLLHKPTVETETQPSSLLDSLDVFSISSLDSMSHSSLWRSIFGRSDRRKSLVQSSAPPTEQRPVFETLANSFNGPYVPPARKVVTLVPTSVSQNEAIRYMIASPATAPPGQLSGITVGSVGAFGSNQPTTKYLIFDTGTFTTVMFSPAFCNANPSHLPNRCSYTFRNSPTAHNTSALSQYSVVADNEHVQGVLQGGTDTCTFTTTLYGTTATESNTAQVNLWVADDLDFPNSPVLLHRYLEADGVMGASYTLLPAQPSDSAFLQLLLPDSQLPYRPIFALDLNWHAADPMWLYPQPSLLHIGGIEESYRSRLVWGPASTDSLAMHTFPIVDMSLCGVSLVANYTTPFLGVVDTGSSCLSLPAELFDAVRAWVPLKCSLTTLGNGVTCSVLARMLQSPLNSTGLPTFGFRMTTDGEWLYVNLADLLIDPINPTSTTPASLCLVRGYSVQSSAGIGQPLVIFGALTLRSLYAVFSMETYQVAFANKATTAASNVLCLPPLQCQGMQTHYTALNQCIDPPCDKYYFFAFDPVSRNCVLETSFHIVVITVIGVFVLTEIVLNEIHNYLSNKIYRTVSAT